MSTQADIWQRLTDRLGADKVAEIRRKMLDRARLYKGAETETFVPENKLTPERQSKLTAHFHECEIPFFGCDDCFELYSNIGYQEYFKLAKLYPEDLEAV